MLRESKVWILPRNPDFLALSASAERTVCLCVPPLGSGFLVVMSFQLSCAGGSSDELSNDLEWVRRECGSLSFQFFLLPLTAEKRMENKVKKLII